jgi:carboxylesterase type B
LFNLSESSSEATEVAVKFREIYFHSANLLDKMLAEWAVFHTDAQFKFPTDRVVTAILQNSSAPIYRYEFSYSGALNFLKKLLFLSRFEGACHFDENFYLFTAGFPRVIPLRKKTKLVDVADQIQMLKWNFAGHFARHNPTLNRWPSIIQEWTPKGTRKRGAPKTRWVNKIVKIGSFMWKRKAQNREKWKELGQAYIL